MQRKNNQGFTFIEVMVVLALVVLTSAIAMVNLLASRRAVERNLCINNRAVLAHAEISYYAHTKAHSTSFSNLLSRGYLTKVPICPTKGVYAWVSYNSKSSLYMTQVGCSVHGK